MQDEITVSIDDIEIGTAENVQFQECEDVTEAIQGAIKKINEAGIIIGKAVYEALEDELNPNHEVVTEIIDSLNKSVFVLGYNPRPEFIPEVAELAKTVPLSYSGVLAICNSYGEGYKDIIEKHREAGETHKALYEMIAVLQIRDIAASGEMYNATYEKHDFKKLFSRKKSKEEKLPKKLRKGW